MGNYPKTTKCVKCGGRAELVDSCITISYNGELYGCETCQATIEMVYDTPEMRYEDLKRYSFERKFSN